MRWMDTTLLLVLNIHGAINSSGPVRKALGELKVIRKFTASVVTDDVSTVGSLKLCKDYVAWAPVEPELLATLLKKRGMATETKELDAAALKKMGYKKHDDLAEKMLKEQIRLSAVDGMRPFFRLAPPKGGFKQSMRRQYTEGGLLGNNPKLAEIVRRMV
jgi:large subunit ribosomal protein L30